MNERKILKILCEHAVIYDFHSNNLKIREGKVYITKYYVIFEDPSSEEIWHCSYNPNQVENRTIWMPERDDVLFCKLIKGYFRKKIEDHENAVIRLRDDYNSILLKFAEISSSIIE